MYCPLEVDRAYHRVLYFLFCENCLKEYRCIRQQGPKDLQVTHNIVSKVRNLGQPREIESDSYSRNAFIKLINNTKTFIEEEIAIEEANSD